jgi:hypothetical protein
VLSWLALKKLYTPKFKEFFKKTDLKKQNCPTQKYADRQLTNEAPGYTLVTKKGRDENYTPEYLK